MTCDKHKTKAQLIAELEQLRNQNAEFEELIRHDTAEHELTQFALYESEERYRTYVESAPDGIFVIDSQRRFVDVNEAACRMTGYSRDELLGMPTSEVVEKIDASEAGGSFESLQKTGELTAERLLRKKDGSTLTVLLNAVALPANRFMALCTDITQRKQVEEALREALKWQEAAFEGSRDAIFISDADARLVRVNEAACQLTRYPREQLLKMRIPDLHEAADLGAYKEYHSQIMAGEEVVTEAPIQRADDTIVHTEFSNRRVLVGDTPYMHTVARDITDRKQAERERLALETQVQQAQKLESLGVLAGGVAHDFNNLLMGVLGNAELALADISPGAPARVSIEEVKKAATGAAELANQMLAYSGRGRFVVEPVKLSEVVKGMGQLLNASIPKTTLLSYELCETIPPTKADVTQIRQVVMNLITNAAEALEDQSGIVKLTTGVMEFNGSCTGEGLVFGELSDGTYSYLEVTDAGVGMDEETVSKMFDPFFTTKFTGRGLGLAAVFGIVRGHEGAIKVESEPGEGTTIRVLFPATDTPTESLRENGHTEAGGTVLLVDDEPDVLDLGKRMLEMAGYEAVTARDGVEAVEVFKQHSRDIKCVILDLTMPQMGGEETFVELQKIRGDVPVLLSSGYGVGEVTARISTSGFAGFIKKPYRLDDLKGILREVVSG